MFKLVLEKAEEPDQIANIRWIMEKAREFQKNIYFCFIDYAKAFDCVDHNKLWKINCGKLQPSVNTFLKQIYFQLRLSHWAGNSYYMAPLEGAPEPPFLREATQFAQFSSQLCPTLCDPMNCIRHARPPCPSPTPRVHSNSHPSSQWCHPPISSSVVPFSCPQSLPASGSFPMSQLFAWGGQSTGVSALASFLPKNTQGWSSSEWIDWISLQSKGLSRVFSSTTVQKHQFFGAQLSLQSNSHVHTWPREKP